MGEHLNRNRNTPRDPRSQCCVAIIEQEQEDFKSTETKHNSNQTLHSQTIDGEPRSVLQDCEIDPGTFVVDVGKAPDAARENKQSVSLSGLKMAVETLAQEPTRRVECNRFGWAGQTHNECGPVVRRTKASPLFYWKQPQAQEGRLKKSLFVPCPLIP